MDSRVDKQVTTDTLIELAELVLKNNIFEFSDKTYKQIRGMTIGTKFAPPYCSTFYGSFRGKGLSKVKRNRMFGGGKLMIYFLFGNMVKNR